MDEIEQRPVRRGPDGRYVTGTSGRPVGSRNRVSRRVARAILRDFEDHQATVLPTLRRWFLPQYLAAVTRLLPRADEGEGGGAAALEALDPAEVSRLIAEARAVFDRIEAGEGTLADLEAALAGAGGEG
jgi:hypothetical protein